MRVAVLAGLVLLGCSGSEPSQPAPIPGNTAPPAPPSPPPPPAAPDPCATHAADFRAAMAGATGRCAADDECGCFNPVVEEAGCGGITDRATSGRLGAIETAWRAAGCSWPHQCGPWACTPACRDGRCVNAGSGGRVLP
jgi:hypothetical protein